MPEKPGEERREVRSDDPTLSPEANQILTEELQEAVGADSVTVPAGAPDRRRAHQGDRPTLMAAAVSNRAVIGISFVTLVIVGAIVGLATGSWWALVAAVAVHAIGTLVVVGGAIALSTETEHPSPGGAARLEEEGVADPDRLVSERIEDYAGARDHNERRADPVEDPGAAAEEQRSTITPAATTGGPGGERSLLEALPWTVALAPLAIAVVAAVVLGGQAWYAPTLMFPLVVGWLVLRWGLGGGREQRDTGRRLPIVPIAVLTTVATAGFIVVMGLVAGYL